MLSEFVIWQGQYTATYQDNIDEWLGRGDDIDTAVYRCEDIDPDGNEETHPLFLDSGNLFSGKTVLLLNAATWGSNNAKKVVKRLQEFDSEIRLGLVFNGGEPSPGLLEMTEDYRNMVISWESGEMADWIVDFLKKNKVLITREEALSVAQHVGYDRGKLVEGIMSTIVVHKGKRVVADDITRLCGGLGELEVFDLIGAIVKGDRYTAAEMMKRFENSDPFMLKGMINSKFRIYAALVFDDKVDLGTFNVKSDGAAYYARKEVIDAGLKKSHVVKALQTISDADFQLTNGSMASAVPGYEKVVLNIMVDSLTLIFNRAHQSARR